ncbi:hypothetical protein T07_13732 [Trichinella nelsoni]|uniref:Uncharacterized protein n=1 Tax=Trichinella nelsoni TaxID=6336 RepID=A0A0V0RFQ8_9BILA|nr:hypothetical protein T07_13732 [Trichinella nelsoni]
MHALVAMTRAKRQISFMTAEVQELFTRTDFHLKKSMLFYNEKMTFYLRLLVCVEYFLFKEDI